MIRILDKNTSDKIAAGEVIDRPVSIVKELIENSIDAGSTSITVEIRDGGRSYIRITDDGCGIPADQLETAFLRHATSKISTENDLDSIETLGFRGEALASICAVSHVELISKCTDSKAGSKIIIEGSTVIEKSTAGCPDGTTITVRDLFFNVPARRKFLKSAASEARVIIDFVSRIAIAYPDIRFRMIKEKDTSFITSGRGNILAGITSVYGSDIGRNLLPLENSEKEMTLRGFVSGPGFSMSSRSRQIFCVNGRIVTSAVMEKSLERAYRERLFSGRFPVAFLFLVIAPDRLDVNIHPTKKEVRFDDSSEIEDFVFSSVTKALMTEKAIPEVRSDTFKQNQELQKLTEAAQNFRDETFQYKEQVDIKSLLDTLRGDQNIEDVSSDIPCSPAEEIQPPVTRPFEFSDLEVKGSIFNTYIAAQKGDVFYLIDQHAAHERIFYEKLMNSFNSGQTSSQQLMIPISISVAADVAASEESWMPSVSAMGFNIEYFGSNSYIVREIPAFMDLSEAEKYLSDIFNQLTDKPDITNRRILDKIIMRSCKSAVKAGDSLSEEETAALFTQLSECENPYSCPHGRPVFIKITKHEIERMFKRV